MVVGGRCERSAMSSLAARCAAETAAPHLESIRSTRRAPRVLLWSGRPACTGRAAAAWQARTRSAPVIRPRLLDRTATALSAIHHSSFLIPHSVSFLIPHWRAARSAKPQLPRTSGVSADRE